MRLYLSSFRLGGRPDLLVGLARGNTRAAVIVNAVDHMTEAEREARVVQEMEALRGLGFDPEELDLRDHFHGRAMGGALATRLEGAGVVWVRGGNAFVLRRAMQASGFDALVLDLLRRDGLVYAGYSACCAMLPPSLRGLELVDDPRADPPGYPADLVWEGLGILPYAIAPHYRSDHPESPDIERVVQYYIDHHVLFRALRDGEVIVVDGEREEIVR
ncbi:MAG TPA: Type 1 glutamine amidotransferase-like domain-containing protein [Longimicrobium sp.]|nr:Type 1 glutamine amidotransferase-like domain-containing protein [Longimicrobium sp.]